jgi:hypothetical protein
MMGSNSVRPDIDKIEPRTCHRRGHRFKSSTPTKQVISSPEISYLFQPVELFETTFSLGKRCDVIT